jgi:hypothetical protein
VLVVGEPGSGKSNGAAVAAMEQDRAFVIGDGHKDSLGQTVMEHKEGEILHDCLSGDHPLGIEVLEPSKLPGDKGEEQNDKRARVFVELLMRRRGGDAAGSPLMEEWIMAAIQMQLYQARPKPVRMLPYVFLPDTDEFRAYLRDCTLPQVREKFRQLEGLKPRALRTEVASASRLSGGVFGSKTFQKRCNGGFDLGAFLQRRGTYILERGDASEDVYRVMQGAANLRVVEHLETRPVPSPQIEIQLDECFNVRSAGLYEEKKAGETRKYGGNWRFICQWLNPPGGPDGYLQNCQRKEVYRSGYEVARQMAPMIVAGLPPSELSRAARIEAITNDIVNMKPGWRWVIDRDGSRREYVPMLQNLWPDWPGLREQMLEEKLCRVYARPEYRATAASSSPSSFDAATLSSTSSPDDSSPASRLNRRHGGKPPADGA